MKISKLFHWLYAFLMILPFIAIIFNFVRFGLSASSTLTSLNDVLSLVSFPAYVSSTSILYRIEGVYTFLISQVFGFSLASPITVLIRNSLTYWTCVSIIYLCFDVVMYIPLLVHRWLDKGVLE